MKSPDRRQFFEFASAAFLLGGLEHASAAPRVRLRKALKFGMVGVEGSLRDKFQAALDAGFEGIELDSPNDLDSDEVLSAKEATGIELPGVVDSVHWHKTLGDPDPAVRAEGVAGLETALGDCKIYGGTTVLLVPAVVNGRISYAEAYVRSIGEIEKVLPLAKELGIQIAIENVWNNFLLSPLEAARYVDTFGSDLVGWYMDIGNIVKYGWPAQWLRTLGKRVLKLDIKDYSRKTGWAKIGEGDSDWPEVMRALADIGYEGWASAEVAGGGPERLKEISERMDRVFAA
ncbi:MAG: xylose isomerase [Planctomycetes bacterium]|nr:xylose isomerase [Planctomycetota bacterium]